MESFIKYVRRIFRKTNIFYSLIRTGTCAPELVINIGFSEIFAYVLNEQSLWSYFEEIVFNLIPIKNARSGEQNFHITI